MKNNFHEAYSTNYNFPLHISSPDSVQAHLDDKVRLLTMLPGQWPKLRGRNITRKEFIVRDVYSFTTKDKVEHVVANVTFTQLDEPMYGKIIDDKYVFSDDCLGVSMPLELIFENFDLLGARPVVRREWSAEYISPYPFWYSLIGKDEPAHHHGEPYFEIDGYKELGFTCLADILAHSYRFTWDYANSKFKAITDPHEITMRLRKPWMQYLVQFIYGEREVVQADVMKLILFLFKKCETLMSDDEKVAAEAFLKRDVGADDILRMADRQEWLNKLVDAYKSKQLLTPGCNVFEDPIFAFIDQHVVLGE